MNSGILGNATNIPLSEIRRTDSNLHTHIPWLFLTGTCWHPSLSRNRIKLWKRQFYHQLLL